MTNLNDETAPMNERPGSPTDRSTDRRRSRGVAIAEFAIVLPLMLVILLAALDLGVLTQARLIVTNVAREGGSIGSRTIQLDNGLTSMMVSSAAPLNMAGPDGRIYVTRLRAGQSAAAPNPTIVTQLTAGGLGQASTVTGGTLGLTQAVYNHLKFIAGNGIADIQNVTVVEVYYKYHPVTGISKVVPNAIIPNFLTADNGGTILKARAVF